MGKGAAVGVAAVGIAGLIAGWKIKEAGEKKRLKQAYDAGYAAGAQNKQNELQPRIASLEKKNIELTNTILTKDQEIVNKNSQLAARVVEIGKLKEELEKLEPKESEKSDEKQTHVN